MDDPISYVATHCNNCYTMYYIVDDVAFANMDKQPITRCPYCGRKLSLPETYDLEELE